MSPRSEEFIEQARDRAKLAREVLASGDREGAVSHSRTHRGTWNLFRERYVVSDAFDDALFRLAQVERMLAA